MKNTKKLIAAVLALALGVSPLFACSKPAPIEPSEPINDFDWSVYSDRTTARPLDWDEPEETPVMAFAMLSDIHLQTEDAESEKNFVRAIETCEKVAGKLDAVAFAGDLVDTTWYGTLTYEDDAVYQSEMTRRKELAYLRDVFDKNIPEGAELVYCLGNHDMTTFSYQKNGEKITQTASEYYRDALLQSEREYFSHEQADVAASLGISEADCLKYGLRYTRMNGCNFVTCDVQHYWREEGAYELQQITWLDNMFDYIEKNHKNEPIFYLAHYSVQNSIPGSGGTSGTRDLNYVLARHPNVIAFTGHIHRSCYNELSIGQEAGYTCVECCSVKYTESDLYNMSSNFGGDYNPEEYSTSQGLLVRVFEDGSTRITRLDFTAEQKAGADWVIAPIGTENRNTEYKLASRQANNSAPVFVDAHAVAEKRGDYLNVKFSPASDADRLVWAYKVTATKADGSTKTVNTNAGWQLTDAPNMFCVTFDDAENVQSVSIVAEDSLFAQSQPLTIEKDAFTDELGEPVKKLISTSKTPDSVIIGNKTFAMGDGFRYEDGVLTNYNAMVARGAAYFPAYSKKYSFSYRISDMRLNKAFTCNGYAYADYRLGACLAAWEYNGRIYSLNASFFFSYTDDSGKTRFNYDKLSYYLLATDTNVKTFVRKVELDTLGIENVDLPFGLKDKLRSENGAVVSVKRNGSTFTLSVDGEKLDERDFAGDYFFNNELCHFDAKTKATFGVSTFGAEAKFTDFKYNL